jgi:hypothetical protein
MLPVHETEAIPHCGYYQPIHKVVGYAVVNYVGKARRCNFMRTHKMLC